MHFCNPNSMFCVGFVFRIYDTPLCRRKRRITKYMKLSSLLTLQYTECEWCSNCLNKLVQIINILNSLQIKLFEAFFYPKKCIIVIGCLPSLITSFLKTKASTHTDNLYPLTSNGTKSLLNKGPPHRFTAHRRIMKGC